MLTFKTYAIVAAAAEDIWIFALKVQTFWLRAVAAAQALWAIATKGYVFWTVIAASVTMAWEDSLIGFSIVAGIAAAMTWVNIIATGIWAAVIGLLDIAMAGLIITVEGLTAAFFALDALLGPIGWITLAIFALIFLYQHFKPFRDAVNWTVNFVKDNWRVLLDFFLPVIGPLDTIYHSLKFIYDMIMKIKGVAEGKGFGGGKGGWLHGIEGIGKAIIRSVLPGAGWIPGFATGGTMLHSGLALVGERGPEVVALPGGSRVHPLDSGYGSLNLSSLIIKVYPQDIYLDSQKLGTVMATVTTDQEARQ